MPVLKSKQVNMQSKKFKFKKVFSLILISYVVMLFIPIILSGYLIFMINSLTASRYRENIVANLEQSCLLLEQKIEGMDRNARKLANQSLLLQIVRFPKFQPGDQNVIQIREFQKYLKTLFPEDMSQYAVILKNGYAFTSSGVTYGREFFFDSARKYGEMMYEEWLDRSFYRKERTLFPFQKVNQGTNTQWAITYNLPVGSYYMPEEADGCVQLFINENFLRDIFQPILRLKNCYVVLYADNGDLNEPVLKLTNTGASGYVEEIMDYSQMNFPNQNGLIHLSGEGMGNSGEIIYNKSETGKFTAVVYMPRELIINETRSVRGILLLLMGIGLVVEIGLGIYFSYRYSTPIKNLIHNIHTILQPDEMAIMEISRVKSGEYDQLESGINQIIQNNNELKSELIKKETRELSDFYKKLFMGIFNREEEVWEELRELKVSMDAKGYRVAVIEAENSAVKVRDLINSCQLSLLHRIQIMENGRVALLFEEDEENLLEGPLSEIVAALNVKLRKIEGKYIPMGLGRAYQRLTDITFSYNQAVYCAMNAHKNSTGDIIKYDDAAQNLTIFYYPADLEEKLINSTRHGNVEQIEKQFGLLWEENVIKRHLPLSMERLLSSNIMATLLKVYSDAVPEETMDSLLKESHGIVTIEEMLLNQKKMFLDICSKYTRTRSGKQEKTRNLFIDFIEKNYGDSQLSVKAAADKFDFSESYFSIIFKESVGEAFSTWLERVRITHAKQLLEEGIGVEIVSERVGYNNSGTFRRAFKRATGISPTEWKAK